LERARAATSTLILLNKAMAHNKAMARNPATAATLSKGIPHRAILSQDTEVGMEVGMEAVTVGMHNSHRGNQAGWARWEPVLLALAVGSLVVHF
jgi:hypothetical protein